MKIVGNLAVLRAIWTGLMVYKIRYVRYNITYGDYYHLNIPMVYCLAISISDTAAIN